MGQSEEGGNNTYASESIAERLPCILWELVKRFVQHTFRLKLLRIIAIYGWVYVHLLEKHSHRLALGHRVLSLKECIFSRCDSDL